MSITCGTQCILNIANNGGESACHLEAIAHVSSILTQFSNVAAISLSSYFHKAKNIQIIKKSAVLTVFCIWLISLIGTGLASLFSPIYLVKNEACCFFKFDSFAIVEWLVISLVIMIICHVLILYDFKKILPTRMTSSGQLVRTKDILLSQFKWRSTIFIIALMLGLGFTIPTTIYELAVDRAPEWLVVYLLAGLFWLHLLIIENNVTTL